MEYVTKKISCGLASSDMFDPGGKIAVTLTSMIKDEGGSVPTIKIMRKLMYSSNKIYFGIHQSLSI